MVRIYLDSNVFRYIKPNHPSYNKELHELMDQLKDDVLFIFSGAHLDDLNKSEEKFRNEDLTLMKKYVKDHYFYRDPIKKVTNCAHATPTEAFNSLDFDAMNEALENPFDFDSLFKDLDDTEEGKLAKSLIDSVFNKPLSSLGETIVPPDVNDPSRQFFDKVFPGYHENMSLKEFMRSIGPYAGQLLGNVKEVTELRKYLEEYMKSETYSYHKWGMEFNERFKDKFGRTFLELVDGMILENQKNDFHHRFNLTYTQLEMFNVTKERSGKGTKKFTYWSLNRDSDHSYFASMCDYFVTDDQGVQVKAAILFDLFGIRTKILSTKEFVEEGKKFINKENTSADFNSSYTEILNGSQFISIESDIESRKQYSHFEISRNLFGFFNVLVFIDYPHNQYRTVLFSFERSPNDNKIGFMNREIELVMNRLVRVFGIDSDGKGEFDPKEPFKNGEPARTWQHQLVEIQIIFHQEDRWVYVNLSIHFINQDNSSTSEPSKP